MDGPHLDRVARQLWRATAAARRRAPTASRVLGGTVVHMTTTTRRLGGGARGPRALYAPRVGGPGGVEPRVRDLRVAGFVGSSLRDGTSVARALHRPCLALAGPAALVQPRAGGLECYVSAQARRIAYRRAYAALAALGVAGAPVPGWQSWTRAQRAARYGAARARAVDTAALGEVVNGLGPSAQLCFEDLLDTAAELAPPGLVTGPGLEDPWCFPLAVPATLIIAPTGPQLYLDAVVGVRSYLAAIDALCDAGVVESSWAHECHELRESRLLLPWSGPHLEAPDA